MIAFRKASGLGWLVASALLLSGCLGASGVLGSPPGEGSGDDDDDATPLPVFDCSTVPDEPVSETQIVGARGYHGLAFDDDGNIFGGDNNSPLRARYDGDVEVFVPGVGYLQQMDFLPDGDLVISSGEDGGLHRVTPDGGTSVLVADVWAYGVLVGPDGMVYSAGNSQIARTDPGTGVQTTLVTWNIGADPHSMNFNRDFSKLYVGTVGSDAVYAIDLDENLDSVGQPYVFAPDVGDGWHDGVGVDVCGNIYVPDYWTSRLYRIRPDGETEVYVDWSGDSSRYGHGAVWGSGLDGWRDDALYLPMPYNGNTVKEIVVGAPYRTWEGEVINAP